MFPDTDLGDKLYEAYVTHNHPKEWTVYSFSDDDYKVFAEYKLQFLRGVDEKYEFNWNAQDVDEEPINWATEENFYHVNNIINAHKHNIGYRRWFNETR